MWNFSVRKPLTITFTRFPMSWVIITCTGSGKIGPEMIKFAFSSCFFMRRSLLLFVNEAHRRTNPRISQACETHLSGLRKDTKLYLTLSLNYLIDVSSLRHIAASVMYITPTKASERLLLIIHLIPLLHIILH